MADKLTNGEVVGVRFSAPGLIQLDRLAKYSKTDRSGYIRHLVAQDAARVQGLLEELNAVFSGSSADSSATPFDSVLRSPMTPSMFGDL